MKIAYVTTYDSSDVSAWSGTGNYILRALQDVGLQTESIKNLNQRKISRLLCRLKGAYYWRILKKSYMRDHEPTVLMNYSTQVEKLLASIHYDIVFSPGTIPIACLQTEKPIVFWTDASWAG